MKQFHLDIATKVHQYMNKFSVLDRRQALRVIVGDPEAFMSPEIMI